ncbi:hypothetical protein [Erythrobacter donghaensis]|jgi:hypothetical protein|uniref:hypothetical protein n=1 Tax=Erythrobacter donghaensis TaxID=267135 RepID=UPI00093E8855|nr:hypothetical protein [Erythrobacter donghaensis]
MAFKRVDQILTADARYAGLVVVDGDGARPIDLPAHHAAVASVTLRGTAPGEVRDAFDRARNLVIYAYFDYDLLVNAEIQALGAVELALRLRLAGQSSDTLHNLVERARKHAIFPKWSRAQPIDRAQSRIHPAGAALRG